VSVLLEIIEETAANVIGRSHVTAM